MFFAQTFTLLTFVPPGTIYSMVYAETETGVVSVFNGVLTQREW